MYTVLSLIPSVFSPEPPSPFSKNQCTKYPLKDQNNMFVSFIRIDYVLNEYFSALNINAIAILSAYIMAIIENIFIKNHCLY